MADDALHLICLVEGDPFLFKVKPTGSMDIMELRKLIHEEGINGVFSSVDVIDLILWKVRMPWPVTTQLIFPQVNLAPPHGDELEDLIGKEVPGSVELDEIDKISSYWPANTPLNTEHLHIIVELSSGE
jgi:hypothetical protein